jgi:hypothetical protein
MLRRVMSGGAGRQPRVTSRASASKRDADRSLHGIDDPSRIPIERVAPPPRPLDHAAKGVTSATE